MLLKTACRWISSPIVWFACPRGYGETGRMCRALRAGTGSRAIRVDSVIRAGPSDAVAMFGRVKQFASHRVRRVLPGTIWGERSDVERINDAQHYRNAVNYILDHAMEGAWVWEDPACAAHRVVMASRERG